MAKRTAKAKVKGKAEPGLLKRLRAHFRADPAKLPVVEQNFAFYERPNLHLAVEELLNAPQWNAKLIGIVVPEEYHSVTLSKLSQRASAQHFSAWRLKLRECRSMRCSKDSGRMISSRLMRGKR